MYTVLDEFKREMAPAKKLYTKEIRNFAKKYEFLGEMSIREEPDIETLDYIFTFEKLNGTSEDVLEKTLTELYNHMDKFSKENGIYEFCINATISYKRWISMDMTKQPQFHLYLLTLNLLALKNQVIPKNVMKDASMQL